MIKLSKTTSLVLKILAAILLLAAALKAKQLLTEPLPGSSIWPHRLFLIIQVEFELLLAVWFLSPLFKKAAWLAAASLFSLFSAITLYKALTGAQSCGCFGSVRVNPWLTLLLIDLPAVILLLRFRPAISCPIWPPNPKSLLREFTSPLPPPMHIAAAALLTLLLLAASAPILAIYEPPRVTSVYEVLEPETWLGKELPILNNIDIAPRLKEGVSLIILYHYDCPDCEKAIPQYEQMARDFAANTDFPKIALIEVPPYGPLPVTQSSPCLLGRLDTSKQWFVTTPTVILTTDAVVKNAWQSSTPDLNTLLGSLATD
jgi:thiol-disulfide isomerase/thioredoxin